MNIHIDNDEALKFATAKLLEIYISAYDAHRYERMREHNLADICAASAEALNVIAPHINFSPAPIDADAQIPVQN